jgi:hypothetical protein
LLVEQLGHEGFRIEDALVDGNQLFFEIVVGDEVHDFSGV